METELTKIIMKNRKMIAAGNEFSLAIREPGKVYGWGQNTSGVLGTGDIEDRMIPTLIDFNQSIISVSGGAWHSLFLDSEGNAYACGLNSEGSLGLPSVNNGKRILVPTKINLESVIDISAGGWHSLFLTVDGKVYGCGSNKFGQLGMSEMSSSLVPIHINRFFDHVIMSVNAGDNYSMFLTTDHKVYGCGINFAGQLGLGDKINRHLPTMIETFKYNITQISCSFDHTLFLTDTHQVLVTGSNDHGQLVVMIHVRLDWLVVHMIVNV